MENISKVLNFVGQFIQALKKAGFTDQNFQEVIASKGNKLAESFVKLISGDYELVLRQPFTSLQLFWKNLYKKYFNLDIDVSTIEEREGKWIIFVAKSLTIGQVYDALSFAKWKYPDGDLDKAVPTNDRTSDKDYVIYVDQNIEADEQFKNKSANDLKKMDHKGITLLERLLLELYYFEETGNHLDKSNYTLCSGSRYPDGDVPDVYWTGDGLKVGWYGASGLNNDLRSRSVVSA